MMMLGTNHQGVVNAASDDGGAHRDRAIRNALRNGHNVGRHLEKLRRERRSQAAEARDDLIEDEEEAVAVADGAQLLEIAFWRQQHPCRSGHRLDDDGGDGVRAVKADQALQVIGKLCAMLGQSPAEGV